MKSWKQWHISANIERIEIFGKLDSSPRTSRSALVRAQTQEPGERQQRDEEEEEEAEEAEEAAAGGYTTGQARPSPDKLGWEGLPLGPGPIHPSWSQGHREGWVKDCKGSVGGTAQPEGAGRTGQRAARQLGGLHLPLEPLLGSTKTRQPRPSAPSAQGGGGSTATRSPDRRI